MAKIGQDEQNNVRISTAGANMKMAPHLFVPSLSESKQISLSSKYNQELILDKLLDIKVAGIC